MKKEKIREKLKDISLGLEDIKAQMGDISTLQGDVRSILFEKLKPDIDTYKNTYEVNQAKMSIIFLNIVRYAKDIEKLIEELDDTIDIFSLFCPEGEIK